MNRRDMVFALLAIGALPHAVSAQKPAKTARIAWLSLGRPEDAGRALDAVKRGMRELNYLEGKDFVFDFGWALGNAERLPDLAKELVARQPDIILTETTPTVLAAKRATSTIPIVMIAAGSPVASGLVKSLARPGGNITGLTNISVELSPKLLDLLLAALPKLSRVAVLLNPSSVTPTVMLKSVQAAAGKKKIDIVPIEAQTPNEIESAFEKMTGARAEAVVVLGDMFLYLQRQQIAELALKHRMPSIFMLRAHAESGGLMSYGVHPTDHYRRAATYVVKILKGAKPGDLPVEQPTTFDFVINLKTAKALGLTIPQSLLLSADTLIE